MGVRGCVIVPVLVVWMRHGMMKVGELLQ